MCFLTTWPKTSGNKEKEQMAMKELRTQIEIQASPEKVWQILTDLDKYPEWNPFIHHAVGKAQVGDAVDITVQSASKEMTLHYIARSSR